MSGLVLLLFMVLLGLGFAGVIALVVLAAVHGQRRAEERRRAITGLAHHREWNYRPSDPSLVSRFSGSPFGHGSGRSATNVLTGHHDGRAFVAFDYHYTTSSGEHSSQHDCSVVALNLGVHAPELSVGPTTTMRRWIDGLTGRDIEIGDPDFDAYFTVHSPAPEFAVDVLLSEVREVMRQSPQLSWRITADSLLVIRDGVHGPGEIEGKLHYMDALLDRIPDTVWDRLRGEQPR